MIQIYNEGEAMVKGISLAEKCEPIPLITIGRDKWKTIEPVSFCIHTKFARVIVEIDAGFITDLDSVPREVPIAHAWLKGRTRTAAVLHDAMYRGGVDRELADAVFLRAMKLEGVKARYRYPIYWAVRLFGGVKYERASVKHAA